MIKINLEGKQVPLFIQIIMFHISDGDFLKIYNNTNYFEKKKRKIKN